MLTPRHSALVGRIRHAASRLRELLKGHDRDRLLGPAAFMLLILLLAAAPVAAANQLRLALDQLADRSNAHAAPLARVQWLLVGWGLLSLLTVALTIVNRYVSDRRTLQIGRSIQELVQRQAATLDLAAIERPDIRDALQRAQHEASAHLPGLVSAIMALGTALVALAASLGVLFLIQPLAAIAVLAVPLPFMLVMRRHAREIQSWQEQRARLTRRLRYLYRLLSSREAAKEVRLFSLGPTFLAQSATLWQQILDTDATLGWKRCRFELLANGSLALAVLAGALYASSQAMEGLLSVGTVVMVVQLLQRTQASFRTLQQQLGELVKHAGDFGALETFLQMRPAMREPSVPAPAPGRLTRALTLHDVSFTYPDSPRPVLRHVNLSIPAGKTVALVGPNGSGKTSLVKLLCRLYDPTTGVITWDDRDLREFHSADLRGQIAAAFQDHVKFEMTVRQNVWLGDTARPLSDPTIDQALRASGADALTARLPHGDATPLGKQKHGGEELSEGEWQSLALARGFVRDASVLLLDEPSAPLDADAERRLFDRLAERTATRSGTTTTVFVSHRLSTVRSADLIVVLNAGAIVEQGTHDHLIGLNGLYARLFELQAGLYRP